MHGCVPVLVFGIRGALAEALRAVFTAREEYLTAAFDAIEREWGGFDAFVAEGLCIDESRLRAFRACATHHSR